MVCRGGVLIWHVRGGAMWAGPDADTYHGFVSFSALRVDWVCRPKMVRVKHRVRCVRRS